LILVRYRAFFSTRLTEPSPATQTRAAATGAELLPSDAALVQRANYVLSIVPPAHARATAQRIITALSGDGDRASPLYFLDLNAIAPSTARAIAADLAAAGDAKVRLVDGGIIGGPPRPPASGATAWSTPSVVLSGPHAAPHADLVELLGARHLAGEAGRTVGTASGLKCCYASLTKGFTALAIQSWTTAARLGVLGELRSEMAEGNEKRAARGLVGMPHKAGRWVAEMHEIGATFREEGGWADAVGEGDPSGIYDAIAEVYRHVAEDTVLGQESVDTRVRGTTVEDVVGAILEAKDKN
jgi:3-hydroxyisobutyrate dehydrogenase-like beta-hydroxyacid dehydrogenase